MKSSSVILYCNRPPVTPSDRGLTFINIWISTLQPFLSCEFLIDSRLRHVIAYEQINYFLGEESEVVIADTSKFGDPGESYEAIWPINVVEHPNTTNPEISRTKLRVLWNAKFGKLLLTTVGFKVRSVDGIEHDFVQQDPWSVHTSPVLVAQLPVNMELGSTPGWNDQSDQDKFSFYPNLKAVKVINNQYQLMKSKVVNTGNSFPPFEAPQSAKVNHGYNPSNFETSWPAIPSNDDVTPEPSSDCLGDVNMDGIRNILDVISLTNYILGITDLNEEQIRLADVNQDGQVNVIDVVNLVDLILNHEDCE